VNYRVINYRVIIFGLLVCCLSGQAGASAVRDTTDKDIDRAITSAKSYLLSQQLPGGSWEHVHYCYRNKLPGGFPTAVITFALLEAGESYENNPRMRRGVEALARLKTNDLRVRALRVMALSRAVGRNKKSPYRKTLIADIKWIARGKGRWGNTLKDKYGDNFCNHLAMTALWDARMYAGVPIPKVLFKLGEKTWIKRQKPNGGWTFSGLPGNKMAPDLRMTAAGLASMYISRDALSTASGKSKQREVMDKAWAYLNKNFTDKFLQKTKGNANSSYTGFCIQQMGMTSGQKFIGGVDWYAVMAWELAKPQPLGNQYRRNAFWGPLVRGAFELIMLAKGRLPLTFNKLDYGAGTGWDYHPRDIARFSEYMQRKFERRMRWQVVLINSNVQTLLDAPMMLVAGQDELKLDKVQWDRLKEYTLRGGTLLFMAVRKGEGFLKSVKEKLKTLYAQQRTQAGGHYELKKLPDSHPLYNVYKKLKQGSKKFPLWGLSDGTRLLAVISEKDVARSWQGRKEVAGQRDYILGVNFFLYATGQNDLSTRMRPIFTTSGKVLPVRQSMKIGWVKHDGNWNTQPYALDYLAQELAVQNQLAVKVTPAVALEAGKLGRYNLLWMTGSDSFDLSDAQLAALRDYLYTGGMLMINAVGGASGFQRSAGDMLEKIFGDDEDVSDTLSSADSPLMTGKCGNYRGPKLGKLARTRAFIRTHPRAVEPVMEYRNAAGRILVAYLRFGMHDTLDGHTAYNAKSYMPPAAMDIAANIALYAKTTMVTRDELDQYKKQKLREKQAKAAAPKATSKAAEEKPTTPDQAEDKVEAKGKDRVEAKEKVKPRKARKKSTFLDDDDL